MKRATIALVLVFALLTAFSSVPFAQMGKKGWQKTVTLPNGDVILDMSGEWDTHWEFYGTFSWIQPVTDIVKITQKGTTFTGVKQIASKWRPKGAETIKGKLEKVGFKEVYAYMHTGVMSEGFAWEKCNWEISENGNKMNLDCGERAKITLIRR